MKQITAVLCKDGWLVEISETRHLYSKSEFVKNFLTMKRLLQIKEVKE